MRELTVPFGQEVKTAAEKRLPKFSAEQVSSKCWQLFPASR
jgi:hypothetical protein